MNPTAGDLPVIPKSDASSDELAHITQEMYKKNLELNERNKTLSLLRKIDEIVLGSATSSKEVAGQIAKAVAIDTDFDLTVILLVERKTNSLKTLAVSYGDGDSKVPPQLTNALVSANIDLKFPPKPVADAINTKQVVTADSLELFYSNKGDRNLLSSLQDTLQLKTVFSSILSARDNVMGLMIIGSRLEQSSISDFQKNLVERLAGIIGIAIDNKLLYEEIQSANRRLKELDEAKDEFISMASHQLRTPLTSIKGYLSMLLEGDAERLNERQHEFADAAYTSTQRVIFLISDMLNVSRINTGKLVIEKAPVDLEDVVQDEIKQLGRTAESRKVKLAYIPPQSKLPLLNLDEGKTRQVIMNFIDNAIYYAPNSTVEVALAAVEDRVRFTVKDQGIGVPLAAQKQLFTKFFRADNAKKSRPDGTGLGLFMAKMVIEMQGGAVLFSSQEGQGSTFGFEFPLDKVKLASAQTITAAKAKVAPVAVK